MPNKRGPTMAVTLIKINKAIKEANRFIATAKKAQKRFHEDKHTSFGCKETGAVRRASMDLTRILVEIRQSD